MQESFLTVVGAIFLLVSFTGGLVNIGADKFFKLEVPKEIKNPYLRSIGFLIGVALIVSQQSPAASEWLVDLFANRTKEYPVSIRSTEAISPQVHVSKGKLLTFAPSDKYKSEAVACLGTLDKTKPFFVGPAGDSGFDTKGLLMEDAPFCSLIAKVGNGAWHFVGGTANSFTSDDNGPLTLTVNDISLSSPDRCPARRVDDCWNDNVERVHGSAVVRVTFSNSRK